MWEMGGGAFPISFGFQRRPPTSISLLPPRITMLAQIVKQTASKMAPAGTRSISRTSTRQAGHHQHYVFEGEFPKGWVTGLSLFVVVGGVGVPVFLMKYQNWKNGFPRSE